MRDALRHGDDPGVRGLSTEQLYRQHRPFVERYLLHLGVRREALDDAVQEVFVTVHRRGGYVQGPAKPTSYLATIAFYTAHLQHRDARNRRARASEHAPDELAAAHGDPARAAEAHEELQRLDRALAKLEPSLRSTLLRADGAGESCVEIAQASSVPLGTVYWRLDRARKKLREALHAVDAARRSGQRRLGMLVVWLWDRRHASSSTKLTLGMGTLVVSVSLLAPRAPTVAPEHAPVQRRAPRHERSAPADEDVSNAGDSFGGSWHQAAEGSTASLRVPRAAPAGEPTAVTTREPDRPPRRQSPVAARGRSEPARAFARALPPSNVIVAPMPTEERQVELSEAAQLARAESLLASHPQQALALVRALVHGDNTRYLEEERDYLELRALWALGTHEPARAREFLRRYPASAFARVVRSHEGL